MKLMVSMAASPRISDSLADKVTKNFPQIPDLGQRLRMLERFTSIAKTDMQAKQTPHENAVELSKQKGKLYVGYRIYKEGRWRCDVHSFVLFRNRVLDPTYGPQENVTYVGMPVPVQDIDNMRYLSLFDRFSYLRKNAPFALMET